MHFEHAADIFQSHYLIDGITKVMMMWIGFAELMLILCFLFGILKNITYLLVMILNAVSMFSYFNAYLNPYVGTNLLLFTAIPMFACSLCLYLLRDDDVWMTFTLKTDHD